MDFYVDIENSAGVKYGAGPLTSVIAWEYTSRMDRAGSFAFTVAATDPMASELQRKRIVRAWAMIDGAWTEVGAGIIDNVDRRANNDGTVILAVSGDDLTRELTYRSVQDLVLYTGGNPVTHSAAVSAVAAFAPTGWTITPDASPPNDSIYGRFNGDSVLAGLVKIAEKTNNHFYRGAGRTLIFGSSFTDSGVRAIQPGIGDLVDETCAIIALNTTSESYDLLTRVYPRGSGNGDVQLTLRNTTRAAPTGYTLDAEDNYIEDDAAVAEYGVIEAWLDYREIGPVANTDTDLQSAANMLYDAALEELTRRNEQAEATYYDVALAGCSELLRPLQSVRMVYRDDDAGLDVDEDVNILEATWRVDVSGVQTIALVLATSDRWPQGDTEAIAGSMMQGQVYQALPQLNANSYVTAYTKNVDETNNATFRFRFGAEVVQVQQVLFEFQLLPFESTVRAVGGATSGSGALATGAPSVADTGAGGNNSSGSGGGGDTGSTTPSIGSATPGIGSATPDIGNATPGIGSATPDIGNATPGIGSATPAIAAATPAIASATPAIAAATPTIASGGGGDTGGISLDTNGPTGGDVISAGRHNHTVQITLGATVTYPIGFGAAGTSGGLVSSVSGSTFDLPMSERGNHTHTISFHTHSISSHTHSLPSHTHSLPSHTHGLDSHTHSLPSHDHTIAAHTHTIASHDHTIAAHTHTIVSHDHTIAAHTHTIASHTHTIAAHTHTMSDHTHSLNNHTHDLSESITAIYGIHRELSAATYVIGELQYRINGGTWAALNTASDAGSGWYALDITTAVTSATVIGRPVQANNTLEINATALAKTVTIDAQLSVRNVIQAIAYA